MYILNFRVDIYLSALFFYAVKKYFIIIICCQSLDGVLDITAQKYNSDSETYLNFYYEKAACYFGIIYTLGSNNINGSRPILFTLKISYEGTQIQFNQFNDDPGTTLNVNKATNNTYVSFEINQNSEKGHLPYLQLWITKIK